MTKLLTRDEFRKAVFRRDDHSCVSCGANDGAVDPHGVKLDAHHIMERRLFPDGGYYLDNGATVCEPCHLLCEQTIITCEDLRKRVGIRDVVLPPHLSCENPVCRNHNETLHKGNANKGPEKSSAVREVRQPGPREAVQRDVEGVPSNVSKTRELPSQTRASAPQREQAGSQGEPGWVHSGVGPSSQEGEETRVELHSGTPSSDGATSKSKAEGTRNRSSQERDTVGQPPGELGDNHKRTPRKPNISTSIAGTHTRTGMDGTNFVCLAHAECLRYDKWGNPILDNGQRLRGELFNDESVQKVLAPVLDEFTNRVKYPRTCHLPWSPGATDDDRIMEDPDACFSGREVVVTEKMDGENCTMYRDYIHARSLEYAPHPSRDRVKAMWAQVAHDIPEGWRVCGENLYAVHSIEYDDLSSYFEVFSVWNDKNECLSWDETVEWAKLLGFQMVSSISRFTWTPELTYRESTRVATFTPERWMNFQWAQASVAADRVSEGYVVRLADSFHYKDFRRSVAKYVRANHVVHRDGHWSNRPVVPNKLRTP